MNVCRQVSIESADLVRESTVEVPRVPPRGARVRVVCAGACYRPSGSLEGPSCRGSRDGAIFPGFEVSGVVDAVGDQTADSEIRPGARVVLYPYRGVPEGYPEFIVVSDSKYLVPIPDGVPLGVAATLPTGALLAMNAALMVKRNFDERQKTRPGAVFKVLIVGTGGLALWAVRLAEHYFKEPRCRDKLQLTVACLSEGGFYFKELKNVNIVHWNEEIFEEVLHERTLNSCNGLVDVVIDFGTTSRSLKRSLRCLNKNGVMYVTNKVAELLIPKFWKELQEEKLSVCAIEDGTVSQLRQLIHDIAVNEIIPPSHSEFPAETARVVLQKLCQSEIPGRAILRFQHDVQ